MRWKDLLWVLAYPIYQVIGTFRHEAGHALGAIAFGGSIEEFVFLPTEGYWGYVRWDGPHNLFTTAAPYLLDLLTFLVFFAVCMLISFRRRWIWINFVIIGVVSPLINSAYNYRPNPERVNDVDVLLRDGSPIMVHSYFILTILLYLCGLYILITQARGHDHQAPMMHAWTVVPLLLGTALLATACSSTLVSSLEPEARRVTETPTPTQEPEPSPLVRSTTVTPTMTPKEIYATIFRQVVAHVAEQHRQRAPINGLEWEGSSILGSGDPVTVDVKFKAGEWNVRLFDWDADDPADAVDVSIWNPLTLFTWRGSATLDQIAGQLQSGGLVPKPDPTPGEWLTYANHRYGYKFDYPPVANVIEHGVSWIEESDVPEGMTWREYEPVAIREMGPNLCAQVVFENGYIWFEAPENYSNNYNFCQRVGPNAPGWSVESRTEPVSIEGQEYLLEGKKLINLEGSDHDDVLRLKLPSDLRIEVGAYTESEEAYQRYRSETLPELLAILETFETFPRSINP